MPQGLFEAMEQRCLLDGSFFAQVTAQNVGEHRSSVHIGDIVEIGAIDVVNGDDSSHLTETAFAAAYLPGGDGPPALRLSVNADALDFSELFDGNVLYSYMFNENVSIRLSFDLLLDIDTGLYTRAPHGEEPLGPGLTARYHYDHPLSTPNFGINGSPSGAPYRNRSTLGGSDLFVADFDGSRVSGHFDIELWSDFYYISSNFHQTFLSYLTRIVGTFDLPVLDDAPNASNYIDASSMPTGVLYSLLPGDSVAASLQTQYLNDTDVIAIESPEGGLLRIDNHAEPPTHQTTIEIWHSDGSQLDVVEPGEELTVAVSPGELLYFAALQRADSWSTRFNVHSYPDRLGVETITFAKGLSEHVSGEDLPAWAGRYIGGLEIDEQITVVPTWPDPFIRHVSFGLGSPGNQGAQFNIDSSGHDGWTFEPDMTNLVEDQTLYIEVVPTEGDSFTYEMDFFVTAPGILKDREFDFLGDEHTYVFTLRSEPETVEAELEDGFLEDAVGSLGGNALNRRHRLSMRATQEDVVYVPMDWTTKPHVVEGQYTLHLDYGDETIYSKAHRYEPDFDEGRWKLSVGRKGSSLKLSLTGDSKLVVSDGLIASYERNTDIQIERSFKQPLGRIPFRVPPLPALTLLMEVGLQGKFTGGTSRVTREVWSPDTNAAVTLTSWETVLGFGAGMYGKLVGQPIRGGGAVNLGVKVDSSVSMTKRATKAFDQNEQTWTRSASGRGTISIVGTLFGYEFSGTLWSWNRPEPLYEELSGPDPVWSSRLIDGPTPSLVMLEAMSLNSAPRVVTQEWTGAGWTPGDVLSDDGRPKFSLTAARNAEGSLAIVYSGLPYGREAVPSRNADELLLDADLWLADGDGQFTRLEAVGSGEYAPSIAMQDETGVLAYRVARQSDGAVASTTEVRAWTGTEWSEPISLGAASDDAEPQTVMLADGTGYVSWTSPEGTIVSWMWDGDSWAETPAAVPVQGRHAAFSLDGQLAMAVADQGDTGDAIAVWTLDSGEWSQLHQTDGLDLDVERISIHSSSESEVAIGVNGLRDGEMISLVGLVDVASNEPSGVFQRVDGGDWAATDVDVLSHDDGVIIAYGQFPTDLAQVAPSLAALPELAGSRFAAKSHLISNSPDLSIQSIEVTLLDGLNEQATSRQGRALVTLELLNFGGLPAGSVLRVERADGTILLNERVSLVFGLSTFEFETAFSESIGQPWDFTAYIDADDEYVEPDELDNALSYESEASFAGLDRERYATPVGGVASSSAGGLYIGLIQNGAKALERSGPQGTPSALRDLGVGDAFAIETWVDRQSDSPVYAVAADSGLWIVTKSGLENVSEALGGDAIASGLTSFVSIAGHAFVTGFTESGDLVAYTLVTGPYDSRWTYSNISQNDLASQGQSTPVFTGDVVSYVTRWNGLNIAGVTAEGDIYSIWWAPGRPAWSAANLSAITGAPTAIGKLSVYLTSWGGINLAAVNDSGELAVTWWVPGAEWLTSSLTQAAGAGDLQFQPLTTVSFTTSWGGLNVAGLDQFGNLRVLWWAPSSGGWQPATLAQASENVALSSTLRAEVSGTGEMSILGSTADDQLVRFWWMPGQGQWQSDVLPA